MQKVVKPARLHFARAARALSEAFCPNIQPRAHARLTGLTMQKAEREGGARNSLDVCLTLSDDLIRISKQIDLKSREGSRGVQVLKYNLPGCAAPLY